MAPLGWVRLGSAVLLAFQMHEAKKKLHRHISYVIEGVVRVSRIILKSGEQQNYMFENMKCKVVAPDAISSTASQDHVSSPLTTGTVHVGPMPWLWDILIVTCHLNALPGLRG